MRVGTVKHQVMVRPQPFCPEKVVREKVVGLMEERLQVPAAKQIGITIFGPAGKSHRKTDLGHIRQNTFLRVSYMKGTLQEEVAPVIWGYYLSRGQCVEGPLPFTRGRTPGLLEAHGP